MMPLLPKVAGQDGRETLALYREQEGVILGGLPSDGLSGGPAPSLSATTMRIPFEIKTDSDIDEAAGFLYLEGEYLVFEWYILHWGISKGETTTVKVERGVIDGIRAEQRWWKDRLWIDTRNLELLKSLPGSHVAQVELRTKRKHRTAVAVFVQAVRHWKERAT
jgi:hypothetical protein